jgi:biotin transport system substrate-specific component
MRGSLAVGLYLLTGALGAPVFAGASGGFTRFLGPTGGFLFGYLLSALTAGLIAGRPRAGKPTPLRRIILASVLGIYAGYIIGLPWLKHILDKPWPETLTAGLLIFIPGDTIKAVLAVLIAPRLRRVIAEQL